MRTTIAIMMKELRVTFTTPVAYVVLAGSTFVTSFLFLRLLRRFVGMVRMTQSMRPQDLYRLNLTDYVISPLVYNVAIVLVFAVPFITMRLVAEEKRMRTFELLQTCPVRPLHIALGKYLASLVMVLIITVILSFFPMLIQAYTKMGSVDWVTVGSGLLGVFIMGAAFTAVGLFVSSVTSSQIIASFITWCVLMLFWMIGWAAADNTGVTRDVLLNVSAMEHVRSFASGVLDIKDLVYFISMALFGLFLTHQTIEAQRWR